MPYRRLPADDVRRVAVAAVALIAVLSACTAGGTGTAAPSATATSATATSPGPTRSPAPAPATAAPTTAPVPSGTAAAPPPPAPAPSATTRPAAVRKVDVQISYGLYDEGAQQVQVAGYAAVVESGGTCTLRLTSKGRTVSAQTAATADASTTSCGTISIDRDQLPTAGTWTGVLIYESASSSGTSTDVTIGVP